MDELLKMLMEAAKEGKVQVVHLGTEPKTENLKQYIKLNEHGYIITNEDMETSIKGVYAAGDVRDKKFRQITTAVADGTIALLNAEKYIVEGRK